MPSSLEPRVELAPIPENFVDLNQFCGLGESPTFQPPSLTDRPRQWPLDSWASAPRDLGYSDFDRYHWKGLRLLKDPETQAALHNLLWDLRPRTIVELGVYNGGSLSWMRDLTAAMGLSTSFIGVDRDLSRCQLSANEFDNLSLHEADCTDLDSLRAIISDLAHPVLFIDDAHVNTFNIMRWAATELLVEGDYFIIEDMIPFWHRYSPTLLEQHLRAFADHFTMDMVYANSCEQLDRGVFRRTGV